MNTVTCTNTIYWVFPLTNNFSTVSMYICIYSHLYIHTETHKCPQQSIKSPQQFYATTGITLDRLGSGIISPEEGSREGPANALSRQLEEMTPDIPSSLNYVLAFGCWWSDNREQHRLMTQAAHGKLSAARHVISCLFFLLISVVLLMQTTIKRSVSCDLYFRWGSSHVHIQAYS